MTQEPSRIIDIVDARAGDFRERTTAKSTYDPFTFLEVAGGDGRSYRRSLMEALVAQPDAGNLLRDGIRFIAFTEFSEYPVTYPGFCRTESSNKPEEVYLRDAGIGRLGRVKSGDNAPRLLSGFEGAATIVNHKYDAIVEVTGDDILYDRLGKIRQTAELLGRSARVTEEAEVYEVITTAANFTRTKTDGDNDVGANTTTSVLSHQAFEDAIAAIMTAKDRRSGQYLGYMADTIIVGPRMEFQVKKLLNSGTLNYGADDETERGALNVYRGALRQIIVSPYFSDGFAWALCDSKARGVVFQQVQPFQVLQATMTADNNDWLERDVIAFKVIGRFGVGMVDDRAWYYSASTTRPAL